MITNAITRSTDKVVVTVTGEGVKQLGNVGIAVVNSLLAELTARVTELLREGL